MIKRILEMAAGLDVHETRSEGSEYCEKVVYIGDLKAWEAIFEQALGTAAKPRGTSATKEHSEITEQYGGVEKGQTLYMKGDETGTTIVMMWPWQDAEHVTLKMVFIKGR
jgi:hypothetical protein